MGILRTVYYYLNWVYIGKKEQKQIDRQRHLKYLTCKQILESNIKLNIIAKAPVNWKNKRKRKK